MSEPIPHVPLARDATDDAAPGGSRGTTTRRVVAVDERTFTSCMEQLQEGYVASVAATAGCFMEPIKWDNWGYDVWLIRPPTFIGGQEVSVYAQLKNTTTIRPDPRRENFSYQFKKRRYLEALTSRPPTGIPGIALIMATSPDQRSWTTADHDSLTTQYCCYWASFEGRAIAEGVERPSVPIPTANIFDAAALHSIMDRIERGEALT